MVVRTPSRMVEMPRNIPQHYVDFDLWSFVAWKMNFADFCCNLYLFISSSGDLGFNLLFSLVMFKVKAKIIDVRHCFSNKNVKYSKFPSKYSFTGILRILMCYAFIFIQFKLSISPLDYFFALWVISSLLGNFQICGDFST